VQVATWWGTRGELYVPFEVLTQSLRRSTGLEAKLAHKLQTKGEHTAWVEEQLVAQSATDEGADRDWTKDELMEKGKQVYNTVCAACHQPNGQGLPPTFPALAGSKIATGPVDAHIDIVLHGKPGTAMAAFGNQLGAVDLAAVITYERNSFGNSTGDVVQPKDIQAAK